VVAFVHTIQQTSPGVFTNCCCGPPFTGYFLDTFQGPSETLVINRPTDSGAAYFQTYPASNTNLLLSGAGYAYQPTTAGPANTVFPAVQIPSENYFVEVTFNIPFRALPTTDRRSILLVARTATPTSIYGYSSYRYASAYWTPYIDSYTGNLTIGEYGRGVQGDGRFHLTPGVVSEGTHTLRLEFIGLSMTTKLDGIAYGGVRALVAENVSSGSGGYVALAVGDMIAERNSGDPFRVLRFEVGPLSP